ncbi:WD repeat-containing protein 18 [Phthorimaea operculella]|nr:WD repeat-containing protein 18 [Phthorimaea operculella]
MANLLEVLVTCDSNNTLWSCSVWDPHTGTNLMSYKGGGTAESRTLSFIADDYIAAVEKTKPILHVWPLNSQQTVQGMRFILPGKASALSISRDGAYCVAGIDEKIYLWQIASGSLLTIINRHYQKVTMVKFTPDGKYFVSAAEDGMVMIWALTTVAAHPEVELVTQTMAGQHDPVYIFSDHSLPVTDLCISKTGMHGRLCTVSSDRTCKIYDLTTGEMLLNTVFDVPLSAVTFDVLELNIFVGTTEGNIYQLSLTNPPRNRDMLVNTDKDCPTFTSHTKAVTCLSVSLDGETLMSGSNDEQSETEFISSENETELRTEERTLREELEKLKKINANLYAFSIEKALSSVPMTINNNSNTNNNSKNLGREVQQCMKVICFHSKYNSNLGWAQHEQSSE